MTSIWSSELMHNPNTNTPIEEIWDLIDDYSFESQFEAQEKHNSIDFVVPLPPLEYKNKVTKGIFYSQATGLLLKKFPELKKIFFACANTMFSSYSHCDEADVYLTCYKNEKREEYYKNKHPHKKHIIFAPLQDADFMNEYKMAPTFNTKKEYDVISVSTAYPVKNLPILASALKVYEKKYGKILKTIIAIGARNAKKNPDGSLDYSQLRSDAKEQLQKVDNILGDTKKYIQFEPYIEYKDLPRYYTASKCCVLTSLIEGKNRSLSEARSCNTPIIVFRDHNKYTRGDFPVFIGNSGEYTPEYTPESLAQTIYKVINNQSLYSPRENYLKYSGRKNFINTLADLIPYYSENIPEYEKGKIYENIWVDLACQKDYQISYHDFLYGKNPAISFVRGLENIEKMLDFYFARYKIK